MCVILDPLTFIVVVNAIIVHGCKKKLKKICLGESVTVNTMECHVDRSLQVICQPIQPHVSEEERP